MSVEQGKRFLIVVLDALRPEFVTPALMPNLHGFAQQGVRFANSRSTFPTETRVNQSAVTTGCYPARHGVVANRGYFDSEEILACDRAGITVTLPKPLTSSAKAQGRFGKQDFRYLADEDVYICPADQRLTYHYTNEENGLTLHR